MKIISRIDRHKCVTYSYLLWETLVWIVESFFPKILAYYEQRLIHVEPV